MDTIFGEVIGGGYHVEENKQLQYFFLEVVYETASEIREIMFETHTRGLNVHNFLLSDRNRRK